MKTVHVHKYSSILSAYGMALADVVHDTQRHCGLKFGVENWSKIDEMMESLKRECQEKLGEQGFDKPLLNPFLHLRYSMLSKAELYVYTSLFILPILLLLNPKNSAVLV